jgi:hypothetical protein
MELVVGVIANLDIYNCGAGDFYNSGFFGIVQMKVNTVQEFYENAKAGRSMTYVDMIDNERKDICNPRHWKLFEIEDSLPSIEVEPESTTLYFQQAGKQRGFWTEMPKIDAHTVARTLTGTVVEI